jgi:3-deoxy-D-manno-octulosonate 8-phosphate phosphatase (KDO 8-P phosphatase)
VDRVVTLPPVEVRVRASRVRLVLTDCDGVLTDAGVYYSARGEELKRFSIRDGMGCARLAEAGIRSAIVTGERSEAVQRRAEKLGIRAYLGVSDKGAALASILADHGASLGGVAYIGDDVNDLGAMDAIREQGLLGAPADAFPAVARVVHHVTKAPGGHGAFREFAEWLLEARAG